MRSQLDSFLTLAEEKDETEDFEQRVELQEPENTARLQRTSLHFAGRTARNGVPVDSTAHTISVAGNEGAWSCRASDDFGTEPKLSELVIGMCPSRAKGSHGYRDRPAARSTEAPMGVIERRRDRGRESD